MGPVKPLDKARAACLSIVHQGGLCFEELAASSIAILSAVLDDSSSPVCIALQACRHLIEGSTMPDSGTMPAGIFEKIATTLLDADCGLLFDKDASLPPMRIAILGIVQLLAERKGFSDNAQKVW